MTLGACGDVAGGVPVMRCLPNGVSSTFADVVEVWEVKLAPRGGGSVAELLAGQLQVVLL